TTPLLGRRPARHAPFPYTTPFRSDGGGERGFRDTGGAPTWPRRHGVTGVAQLRNAGAQPATARAHRASGSRRRGVDRRAGARTRSEEHTSELQSRENLVCRLLPEK